MSEDRDVVERKPLSLVGDLRLQAVALSLVRKDDALQDTINLLRKAADEITTLRSERDRAVKMLTVLAAFEAKSSEWVEEDNSLVHAVRDKATGQFTAMRDLIREARAFLAEIDREE